MTPNPITLNPIEMAGIPTAVAILKAFQQFTANLGPDPAVAVAKLPGAFKVFVGTVEMQFPALASAELGAVQTDINSKVGSWITTLEAAKPA